VSGVNGMPRHRHIDGIAARRWKGYRRHRGAPEEGEPLKTTIITAYELLKGAASSSKPRENMRLVKEMLSNINILTLSYGACEEASRIYVKLRRRGVVIGEFDLLIAAIAIHNDELLLSRDKHFKLIEELKIETW